MTTSGLIQERNRGGALHALVCQRLGYDDFQDDGQFPDLPHQLLEIKLQTSRTIDLGLVLPSSADALDMPMIDDIRIRICDVRYALFFAVKENDRVVLTHLVMTTGERFFDRFPLFKGNLLNTKMQIRYRSTSSGKPNEFQTREFSSSRSFFSSGDGIL